MNRIYCNKCKHFNCWSNKSDMYSSDTCSNPKTVFHKFDYEKEWIEEQNCSLLNQYNNCKYFEQKKWWYIRKGCRPTLYFIIFIILIIIFFPYR